MADTRKADICGNEEGGVRVREGGREGIGQGEVGGKGGGREREVGERVGTST